MNDPNALAAAELWHAQCLELLPWHVNRTLKPQEAEAVRRHLGSCLACRQELARLELLAAKIAGGRATSACEDALRRLHARMEHDRPRRPQIPWAAAAVLVLTLGLSGVLAHNTESSVAWLRNFGYSMLSQTRIDAADSTTLHARLVFYDDITERQLRALLLAVGAEVVDGPTPQGVYTIAFPQVRAPRDFSRALSKLRYSRHVIFAEPAPASTKVSDFVEG